MKILAPHLSSRRNVKRTNHFERTILVIMIKTNLYNHIHIAEAFIIQNSLNKRESFVKLLLGHIPFLDKTLQIH